jgi:hypothetical protein
MLKPLGSVNVRGCRIEQDRATHRGGTQNVFVVIPPRAEGSRVFFLSAESENEMTSWILALKKAAGVQSSVSLFANPAELLSDALGNRFFRPLREGFLEVHGKGNIGKWKNRFVVCRKNVLLLFESKEAVALHSAIGVIPLLNCTLEVQEPQKRLLNSVAYRTVSRKVGMESRREFKWNVQHSFRRHYILSAPNESLMTDWIAVCAVAVGQTAGANAVEGGDGNESFLSSIGSVAMSGELMCSVQGKAGAERKFVVISENVMFFCRDSKSPEASSALDLENAAVKEVSASGQFALTYMSSTVYLFDCRSANLRAAWLDAISRGVEVGRRLNVEARMKLNGDTATANATSINNGVIREVEQFSVDRSAAAAEGGEDNDYATTQQLSEVAVVDPVAAKTRATPTKSVSAAQRPVWGKKPSQQLMPRESKAVGQYRKPVLPLNLKNAAAARDDNDELLGLLNDPIFSGSPREKSKKPNPVCLNCGLMRLEVEANFCDGCGERFTESTVHVYADEDNLDDVVSLDDSEKAFLAANGTSEAELSEVKKELVRVSTFQGPAASSKQHSPRRVPPVPPVTKVAMMKEERRSSRSGDFRPMRNSMLADREDDDSSMMMSLPALPMPSDSDDEEENAPTPPPRTSTDKRKMKMETAKRQIDDDDPLALLDLLDWDDVPAAKKSDGKKEEEERRRRREQEKEEEEEKERRERERRRQSVMRRNQQQQEEEDRKRRHLEDEEEKKRRKQEAEDEEKKRRFEEEEKKRRKQEEEEKKRRKREEEERKTEEERAKKERDLREREERLQRMERELQEKEMEAKRRELAALAALEEAEELKRRRGEEEKKRKEQARREEEERQREEEERRRKEEEERRKKEAKQREREERRKKEEEMARKEEEMIQRAADLERRELEAREVQERVKREREEAREVQERAKREREELERRKAEEEIQRKKREKEEAERKRQEDELARKEEEMRQRSAELERREREAKELQERAKREREETERRRQEDERLEQLEKSRRARDAAKKAKEAKVAVFLVVFLVFSFLYFSRSGSWWSFRRSSVARRRRTSVARAWRRKRGRERSDREG